MEILLPSIKFIKLLKNIKLKSILTNVMLPVLLEKLEREHLNCLDCMVKLILSVQLLEKRWEEHLEDSLQVLNKQLTC